ncbi:MAG: flagellar basal-body MS-ring/collar protein FliF [Gammaproteobacteria bacterium]|nr:flagellar basal-body MS-ring/collar protein FliF [Gammaproteobacteria bacterium]
MMSELGKKSIIGFVIGIILITALTIGLLVWNFSSKKTVLFNNLNEKEAANIITSLEEMKVPYSFENNGTTLLVDEENAQALKVKLVGSGIPVNSGNGFELFDDADIGMTEYSQKITYLRAMQGELARSVMSIEGIKYARVHLVLPETSLFRQKKHVSSASVTVIPEAGETLDSAQVVSIQRLIASSAPGIEKKNVTVIDNNGVTLSSVSPSSNEENITAILLKKKQKTEAYLQNKVNVILNKTFGINNSVAIVSVEFDLNKVHRKEEIILPNESPDVGVIRKRETKTNSSKKYKKGSSPSTIEMDYQLSRRTEEVVSIPGAVRRIQLGILVPENTDKERVKHLKEVIAMAVGLDAVRGDNIAIYPMKNDKIIKVITDKSEEKDEESLQSLSELKTKESDIDLPINNSQKLIAMEPIVENPFSNKMVIYVISALIVLFILTLIILIIAINRKKENKLQNLSNHERDQLLIELKQWLNKEAI